MIARWAQVLAHGQNVDLARRKIAEHFQQLVAAFTDADHYAGLAGHVRIDLLHICQKVQGALVAGAGTHGAVKTRDGFGVVVQDLWLGIDNDAETLFDSLEVGNQDLDTTVRDALVNLLDSRGEDAGAAIVVIIPIDAGDYGELEAKCLDGFGDAARFVEIDRFRAALGHGAESAAARAGVAEQHESCCLVIPAFADIGALGRLADRVQIQTPGELLEVVVVLAHGCLGAQPRRLRSADTRSDVNLNKVWGSHELYILRCRQVFRGFGKSIALKRMQVSEQVYQLLVGQGLAKTGHLGFAHQDDVGHARVVGGQAAGEVLLVKYAFQAGAL